MRSIQVAVLRIEVCYMQVTVHHKNLSRVGFFLFCKTLTRYILVNVQLSFFVFELLIYILLVYMYSIIVKHCNY